VRSTSFDLDNSNGSEGRPNHLALAPAAELRRFHLAKGKTRQSGFEQTFLLIAVAGIHPIQKTGAYF